MPSDAVDPKPIFASATERARAKALPMQGLLTPAEAWTLFAAGEIELVDTRTVAERDLIGYVPGSISIEWYDYPAKTRNERFVAQLRERVESDRPVAFLCRSGVRSDKAAALATENGFASAFNIVEGFEGDKNAQGQRRVNGWQMAGLPWRQD